jgi:hypothetical protein
MPEKTQANSFESPAARLLLASVPSELRDGVRGVFLLAHSERKAGEDLKDTLIRAYKHVASLAKSQLEITDELICQRLPVWVLDGAIELKWTSNPPPNCGISRYAPIYRNGKVIPPGPAEPDPMVRFGSYEIPTSFRDWFLAILEPAMAGLLAEGRITSNDDSREACKVPSSSTFAKPQGGTALSGVSQSYLDAFADFVERTERTAKILGKPTPWLMSDVIIADYRRDPPPTSGMPSHFPTTRTSQAGTSPLGAPPESFVEGRGNSIEQPAMSKPARRNPTYQAIDSALRDIGKSLPKNHDEVFEMLEGRARIPNAKPFKAAGGWQKGFQKDPVAARAWLSKHWARLRLRPFMRGPK